MVKYHTTPHHTTPHHTCNIVKSFSLSAIFLALSSTAFANGNTGNDNLDEINVSTSKLENNTTEDSGSYTTDSMNTATGLALSIRQTPQSVSVISNQLIKDLKLRNIEEALTYADGINVAVDTGMLKLRSRGFDIDNIQENGIASTVASNSVLGGVSSVKQFSDLAFYDRIEVLRGAAGLTQSNGAPGGTVNLQYKKPTKEFRISGSHSIGSWDNYRNVIDVSGSLNTAGTIRSRVIGLLDKTGSFKEASKGYKNGIFANLEVDLTENTLFNIGGIYQKSKAVPDIYGVPVKTRKGTIIEDISLPVESLFTSDWATEQYEKTTIFSELSHKFNDDWKGSVKLNHTDSRSLFLYAGYPGWSPHNPTGSLLSRSRYDFNLKEISAKAEIIGKYELFGRKHDLFANISGSREKYVRHNRFPPGLPNQPFDIYNFNRSAIAEPDWGNMSALLTDSNSNVSIYQQAIALGTQFNATENWHLLIGGRYSKVKYDRWTINNKAQNEKERQSYQSLYEKQKLVPYAGLTWDFMPQHSWYISYAEIFKPQDNKRTDGSYLDPLVGYNAETGIKSEWFEGRLNSSFALFQTIQKNRALCDPNDPDCDSYVQQGRVRSRGLDFSVSGALTENWQVGMSYTYTKSVFMEDEDSNARIDASKGARANLYEPQHLVRFNTSYLVNDKLTLSTAVRYQSQTQARWRNTLDRYFKAQRGFVLWDLGVDYKLTKNIDLGLSVKNVTNKKYYLSNNSRSAGSYNYYGEPRNIIFSLNWQF